MAQSEESQMAMFGCIIEAEKSYVMSTLSYKFSGAAMVLTSLLSDVQHHIEHGNKEDARKMVNAVKYLLNDAEFMAHHGE